jgi:hypothetical protein
MWFDKLHFKKKKPSIILNNLHGYILPHAGTKYTHNILKHTLRFKPSSSILKNIKYILIAYLPSSKKPNVGNFYHEFYVLKKVLRLYYPTIKIIGLNILDIKNNLNTLNKFTNINTLFILSVDFSHFYNLHEALDLENCAAHSLMFHTYNTNCIKVVDDIRTFKEIYKLFPFLQKLVLQWIGRSRSPGIKGVGYLSFLLRTPPNNTKLIPDGLFVTAYDKKMNSRECLGNTEKWSPNIEKKLITKVLHNAKTTSRLTNGQFLSIPISNYTITYLYKSKSKQFIRGYHAIMSNALYLPDVFLENTYENGTWIKNTDNEWIVSDKFYMKETLDKLYNKSLRYTKMTNKTVTYKLFTTQVLHKKI